MILTQVEELDERMQKLTHKLENARRDFDYEKAQRVLDKIDAHQHEKELKVQEKLKASERKLEKAKKAGNSAEINQCVGCEVISRDDAADLARSSGDKPDAHPSRGG